IKHLREHHGDDHERDARCPERQRTQCQRQHEPGNCAGEKGGAGAPPQEGRGKACPIDAGRKEHGMAEAQEARITEEQIVAGSEDRKHNDTTERKELVVVDRELQAEYEENDRDMEKRRANSHPGSHRAIAPKSPCGLKTSTRATMSVASILARVGEKNTETMPSLSPMTSAAARVPCKLPSPPMMTTMKESSSASWPIR